MARNRKRNRGKGKGQAMMAGKKAMPKMGMEEDMPPSMTAGMGAATPEAGSGGQVEATEEEEEMYKAALAKYVTGMYVKGKEPTKDGSPPLLEQIHAFFRDAVDESNRISFVDVLGNITARAVMALEDKLEDEGGTHIPGDVLMHVGEWILNDLAELSEAAGYHEYTPQEITGAATQAFSIYGSERQSQGRLDTDAIQADYNEIVAADKAGKLDDVIPGASQAAEELSEGEQGPPVEPAPEGMSAAMRRPPPGRGVA